MLISELQKKYEYNRLPLGKQASDSTKRKNVVAMNRILRVYGVTTEDNIDSFSMTIKGQPIGEHYAQYENKVTDVRMARSLFSKGWMKYYRTRCGIDTSLFTNWTDLILNTVRVKPFQSDEKERILIERNCAALESDDLDLYKSYALAYGLGLRSSEIQRSKYGDLWKSEGNKIIRIWSPKGVSDSEVDGVGYQDRPCDPSWWELIKKFSTGDNDLIIQAHNDRVIRDFPKFLREKCGVNDTRPVHRLRKYAGHRAMRLNQNNAFVAQKVLGHSSVEMTTKIYVGLPSVTRSF